MRKIFFYLFCFFCLTSCSRNIIYVYENNQTYCTLELTPRNDITFRSNYPVYSYINSSNGFVDYKNCEKIRIITPPWLVYYNSVINQFDECPLNLNLDNIISTITYKRTGNDSILLAYPTLMEEFMQTEPCFSQAGIDWFPSFMVKAKKIDYARFGLPQVQKKYLKNPDKIIRKRNEK